MSLLQAAAEEIAAFEQRMESDCAELEQLRSKVATLQGAVVDKVATKNILECVARMCSLTTMCSLPRMYSLARMCSLTRMWLTRCVCY